MKNFEGPARYDDDTDDEKVERTRQKRNVPIIERDS